MKNWTPNNPFTLGQVLSLTHERLMCDVEGLYSIMNHMTGQSLYTHQLPRASVPCREALSKAHPHLLQIDLSGVNRDNWQQVLAELVAIHGNAFEAPVLDNWTYSDPLQSAIELMGADKVIPLQP